MLLPARALSKAQESCGYRKVKPYPLAASYKRPHQLSNHLEPFCATDMSELKLTKGTSINFPEGKDKLMHFEIRIQPEDGMYK